MWTVFTCTGFQEAVLKRCTETTTDIFFEFPKAKEKNPRQHFQDFPKKEKKKNTWEIDYSEQKRERWQICTKIPSAVVLETPAQQF